MWEMWDELACKPVILNSMLVVLRPAVTVIVPLEVTEESAGFSLKLKIFPGAGDLLAEADGDRAADAAVPIGEAPHAATQSKINGSASQHRVLGKPQQVTGAGREFSPGPLAIFEKPQTWCAAGAGRRRERQKR